MDIVIRNLTAIERLCQGRGTKLRPKDENPAGADLSKARPQMGGVDVYKRQEECTFFFPAVCEGGGAVAGVISQEGTDHQRAAEAAKAIRTALEGLD